MKNGDFNIFRDLFGYQDMDFDGDVDLMDVDLEDEIFCETERDLHPNITSDFDEDDDFDYDDFDDYE